MRRDTPTGRKADLPADDVPSAEVLDELLRAFSADAADTETLEGIDLASPEVAELIAPTAAPPVPDADTDPRPEVESRSASEGEGEVRGECVGVGPGEVEVDQIDEVDVVDRVDADDDVVAEHEAGATLEDVSAPHLAEEAPHAGDAHPTSSFAAQGRPPAVEPGPTEHDPTDHDRADQTDPTDQNDRNDENDQNDQADTTDQTDGGDGAAGTSGPTTRTVVIDASHDPPDAVYLAAGDPLLNASVAGRGSHAASTAAGPPADTTVFIDDQAVEAGETISMADASTATRIEPRLRERRIAVKRAVGRKRLRWAFVVGGVLVVVVAALAVLGSSLFAIDEVRVDGAARADAVRLQAVVEELEGTPVLRADTDRAERELEAIPWVASARVTTQFPDGATVELRERTPVATYQGPDQSFRVIDIDGRVLEVLDAQPVDQLLIQSPDVVDLEPGQFSAQGFIAAANLVQALTPEARALAATVTVTGNGGDLRMTLTDGREVRFGPGRDLVVKLVRLQTKLQEPDAPGFRYLDVSTDDVTTG